MNGKSWLGTRNDLLPMPSPIMARDGNVVFFAYWVDEIDAYKFIVWGEGKDAWNPEQWIRENIVDHR